MKILRNKRVWRIWANKFYGFQRDDGYPKEPKQFPCFVYTTVRSFNFQEENENYLYAEDLKTMLEQLSW